MNEKTLKDTTVFDGHLIRVHVDDVELDNGMVAKREIVSHPGGVSVAILTEKNELLFVKQFRCPYQEELLELPAGKLEPGEDPFEAMKREQLEETGTTGKNYISLGNLYPTPGYCGEIIRLWACRVDKETGEETVGWSYKAHDPLGKTKRKRRRRASNLADDLTKEGVEAYFEEKQRQAEAQKEDAPAPVPVATVAAEPQPDSPAEPSFDVYAVEESDVAQMAGDLQRAHITRCRESGEPFMGERYGQLVEAERHPEEQLAKLQAEVDAARREFHASKEARDALNHPCPNLLAGAWVFAKAGRDARDPVSRMMADMTAMMLRMLIQQAMEEQRRREREAAERRLYESRRNMWDAEKRLKSAEKALAHEDEREEQAKLVRLQEREDKAARRAGGRVKYGADADKQYE